MKKCILLFVKFLQKRKFPIAQMMGQSEVGWDIVCYPSTISKLGNIVGKCKMR